MSFDYEKANEMLTRAKAGDQQAFAYLYEAYYTYAYTGTEKLGTIEDREDATQEAFVKCFAKLQAGDNITNFGTYIKHTAQNVATDMIKAREAGKRINADSNIVSNDDGEEIDIYDEIDSEEQVLYAVNEFYKNPETLYEKEEVKALLDEILGVLTTEQRESLIMQYMEGYKQTEIADVYGVSVNTVKSYVNQGKAKVKKKVTEIENRRGIKIQGSLLAFFFALLHTNIEAEAATLPVSGAAFVSAKMAASTSSKGILGAIKAFFSKSVSVAGKTISTKAIAIATAGTIAVGSIGAAVVATPKDPRDRIYFLIKHEQYEKACKEIRSVMEEHGTTFEDDVVYLEEAGFGKGPGGEKNGSWAYMVDVMTENTINSLAEYELKNYEKEQDCYLFHLMEVDGLYYFFYSSLISEPLISIPGASGTDTSAPESEPKNEDVEEDINEFESMDDESGEENEIIGTWSGGGSSPLYLEFLEDGSATWTIAENGNVYPVTEDNGKYILEEYSMDPNYPTWMDSLSVDGDSLTVMFHSPGYSYDVSTRTGIYTDDYNSFPLTFYREY